MNHRPDPVRLANTLDRLAGRLRRDGDAALRLTADWQTSLAARRYDGTRSRPGGPSDPTSNAALGAHDETAAWYTELTTLIRWMDANAVDLESLIAKTMIREKNQPRTAPAGAGECRIPSCDRYCSGANEDRLKSGYCPADYQRWVRAGRPDRAWWERTGHDLDLATTISVSPELSSV